MTKKREYKPWLSFTNQADTLFLEQLKSLVRDPQYSTEGHEVRTKWEDKTPAHTVYKNNILMNYLPGEIPLISFRPQAWKSAIKEVLWIYQDQSNDLDLLKDKYGITWWDKWEVNGTRTIGHRYGHTVKRYGLIDKLIDGIKNSPMSRRHIIDLYQYEEFSETEGLVPCAMETIWTLRDNYLDMVLIQRSSDMCVALSINQFQYYALLVMIAKATGYEVGEFSHMIANLHIYDRHMEGAEEMIQRAPEVYKVATEKIKLEFNPKSNDFYSFTIDDFKLVNYNPINRQIKFELAE